MISELKLKEVCDGEGHQFCALTKIYTIQVGDIVLHLPIGLLLYFSCKLVEDLPLA